MARTKIHIPDEFRFKTDLKVRISDINYGGHLGNDSIASMIHEARYQFFNSLGYEDEISVEGVGTIQADIVINYKNEAFHGDQILIQIAVTDITRVSMDLIYVLTELESQKVIAHAKTTIVTYDYTLKKKVNIPQRLLEKIT